VNFAKSDAFELMNRRTFLKGAATGAVAVTTWTPRAWPAPNELTSLRAEVEKRHDENVRRLQEWIHQPSIAAENRGVSEGCDLTIRLLRDAGFDRATRVPTDGQPGIFATLDAGAPRTVGLYFMYDVKQVDAAEWSSPPWDAALVNKPGLGKVLMGRGAVNQKGPQAALLAAFSANRASSRSSSGPRTLHRCLHAFGRPGPRWCCHAQSRRQGHRRT
jgi:hypothetical protein